MNFRTRKPDSLLSWWQMGSRLKPTDRTTHDAPRTCKADLMVDHHDLTPESFLLKPITVKTPEGERIYYKVSLSQTYREGTEFQSTTSLGRDDLPVAALLLQQAWAGIVNIVNIVNIESDADAKSCFIRGRGPARPPVFDPSKTGRVETS